MPRTSLDELVADLAGMPTELRRQIRPALNRAVAPIQRDAQRRASWSRRIPGAIKVKTSFAQRSPGLRLFVDVAKAPHARPYEDASQRNKRLRHPVFLREGRREVWVEQDRRPFFFPAVQAGRAGVVQEVAGAVAATARSAGFR